MKLQTHHHASLDSTNTRAAALAAANPGKVLVVSADQQHAGRGRSGRTWQSPVGGAWFSIAWPTSAPAEHMQAAPVAVGLSIRQTLTQRYLPAGAPLHIKWPNDLLYHDAKLAGILCEQVIPSDTPQRTLIVGVGVNVNLNPADLSSNLRLPATSLARIAQRHFDIPSLIADLASDIAAALASLETRGLTANLAAQASDCLAWQGQRVRCTQHADFVEGVIKRIDDHGRLVIMTDKGMVPLDAGEVQKLTVVDQVSH